ncbi:alpha/beta hydrolase [Haladaptatus sp. F3-133]|uniref:Alpha/beta hydrolase n=1 Tax=Halorutilus salinus TaxID=2487751 RepID=A0A9Q4C2R4_9EURY|nr:alpha/beta hydrolase [Halorutilus salinus]MCX2817889.1 alpha/beta hydrolase [Halorutilus salinus]
MSYEAGRGELDPQVESVLEMVNSIDFALSDYPPEEARDMMERMAEMSTADPVDVDDVREETTGEGDGVGVRVYEPEDAPATVVFFHGGGFVVGSLETHDSLCRLLADRSGLRVVSVDYRLAPEHPFPSAVEDAYEATKWAANRYDGAVGVAGDSAGGTLSAVVSLIARDRGMPDVDHQTLLYPATAYDEPMPSRSENASGYFLEASDMMWFASLYVGSDIHARNPYAFPLRASDHTDLPRAHVVTAGYDPLRDEGAEYARVLDEAGNDVTHTHYPSLVHGFLNMEGLVDRAYDAVDEVADETRDALV